MGLGAVVVLRDGEQARLSLPGSAEDPRIAGGGRDSGSLLNRALGARPVACDDLDLSQEDQRQANPAGQLGAMHELSRVTEGFERGIMLAASMERPAAGRHRQRLERSWFTGLSSHDDAFPAG